MAEERYNLWTLLLTKVLPILATLLGTYMLLYADLRYVKKEEYLNHVDMAQLMKTDLEVIKAQNAAANKQLDRIERKIQ